MAFDWWTLALQAVNVLILAWLLGRFFFRPVAAVIAKRQAETQTLLSGAEDARAAVDKAKAEIAATREGFAAEREKMLAEAKAEAEAARAAFLKEAEEQAGKLRKEQEASWQNERAAMEKELLGRAGTLAVEISRRLMQRLSPKEATTLFVDSLAAEMSALPPQSRALIASAASRGIVLDLVAAAPLSDPQKDICRQALKAAAGRDVNLTFNVDPMLIAGIEIRGPEIIISNHWRGDLDRILKELTKDAGAFQSA